MGTWLLDQLLLGGQGSPGQSAVLHLLLLFPRGPRPCPSGSRPVDSYKCSTHNMKYMHVGMPGDDALLAVLEDLLATVKQQCFRCVRWAAARMITASC